MFKNPDSNRLLAELLAEGKDLSETELKRVYRRMCKLTHPDVTGSDGAEFARVNEEYQEAKVYLGRLEKVFGPGKAGIPKGRIDAGRALYVSLLHYTAAGLHSNRVRLKPALRLRNRQVIEKVIRWAGIHDPSFIPVFMAYNKSWLIKFTDREVRVRLKKARRLFLDGLNFFFDFMIRGNTVAGKICASYLKEACFEFLGLDQKQVREAYLDFAGWLLKEMNSRKKGR